jgi:hypothetical protein
MVCYMCIDTLLLNALGGDAEWREPACPEIRCGAVFTLADVLRLGTPEQAATLRDRRTKRHPNYRYCLSTACNMGQLHEEGSASPRVVCNHCGAESCFNHRVPWHESQMCEQWVDQKKDIDKSEKWVKQNCKVCPTCRMDIQRDRGCNVMNCRYCHTYFCWQCCQGFGRNIEAAYQHRRKCCRQDESPRE